jgi:rod shape determining protein RodA
VTPREGSRLDPALWIAAVVVVGLTVVGLVNLRNAAAYAGADFHQAQVLWVVLGLLVAAGVAAVDMRLFEQLSPVAYWTIALLLLLVLLFGTEINHSKRWFNLGFASFQPSEFMKPAVVLMLARFFHSQRAPERYTLRMLLKPMGLLAIPVVLILAEPDLGTTLVVIAVGFSVMFFEGVRLRSFLILLGTLLLVVPIAWETDIIQSYQKDRVRIWLGMTDSSGDAKKTLEKNMQPEQALWAVGAGRLAGKGGGLGVQSRLKYLPEMHTDYILATFAEERGFVGCLGLMAMYLALIFSLLRLAVRARERFGVLVSVGAVAILFWQVLFNVGMVIGIFPVVGLTLPFMSYGGSSTLSTMFAVGLALNAGIHKGQV